MTGTSPTWRGFVHPVILSRTPSPQNHARKSKIPVLKKGKAIPKPPPAPKRKPLPPPPRRSPPKSRSSPSVVHRPLRLGECATKYALAIVDPWSEAAMGACVPIAAGLTQKVTSFLRGSSFVGTAGYAFLSLSPCLANDIPSMYVTDNTFTQTSMSILTAANTTDVGVNRVFVGGLPYSSAQFIGDRQNPAVGGRIVSVGLKVWYTGTVLEQAGVTYCLRDPAHASVQAALSGFPVSINDWGGRRETDLANFTRRECMVTDFANTANECNVMVLSENLARDVNVAQTQLLYPFSKGETGIASTGVGGPFTDNLHTVAIGVPTAGVQIVGTAGQPFNYQYIIHAEFAGPLTAALGTKSEGDVAGTQAVMAAAAQVAVRKQSSGKGVWSIMYDALLDITQGARELIVPAAIRGVAAMLM